jgi:DNA-binding transcriptional LysR family regulator
MKRETLANQLDEAAELYHVDAIKQESGHNLGMAITLNQLRYFSVLADTKHFGRAAERLNMSQPPLSRQIQLLEDEVGAELFERTRRGVVLTSAGEQYLSDAKVILRLIGQAERNATAAGRGEIGELAIGFTMCAAYSTMPTLMKLYASAFPDVSLRIRELMPNALEPQIKDGEIDLGITFPGIEAPDAQTQPLFREPLEVALPYNHPLAQAEPINVADLANERFLIVPRSQAAALHDSIVRRCQAAGFTPIIGLEVYLQQTIVNFVAEDMGIAFVPSSMKRTQVKGVVFKPIPNPPTVDLLLVWSRTNKNPCISGFLAIASALGSPSNVEKPTEIRTKPKQLKRP